MRLTVVGCSGSFPGPASSASCYLLAAEGFKLVVDLGNGSIGALQRYTDIFDVDAVALSHLHADHCVDLYSYAIARELAPGGPYPAIPVYGPAGTTERMAQIHGGAGADVFVRHFTQQTLAPGKLEIGPFAVELAHTNHPVETFAYRFTHGGKTLVYTGDTGLAESIPGLAKDADVFLSEAAFLEAPGLPPNLHLTARQAGAYASRGGVGSLVLTHILAWTPLDAAREEAATAYDGPLEVATTGQIIDLAVH